MVLAVFNVRIQDEDGSWSSTFKRVIDFSTHLRQEIYSYQRLNIFWDMIRRNATALIAFNGAYDEAMLNMLCRAHLHP